jgi:hypothetical protein
MVVFADTTQSPDPQSCERSIGLATAGIEKARRTHDRVPTVNCLTMVKVLIAGSSFRIVALLP